MNGSTPNPLLARMAGALAALVVTTLLGLTGLDVTDEQKAGVVGWLTQGLTALGGFLMLVVYGAVHRMVSRRTNPADVAAPSMLATSAKAGGVEVEALVQRTRDAVLEELRGRQARGHANAPLLPGERP